MDYKLIAIDMDGTFLDKNHKISKENLEAVKKVISKGKEVIIATGRSGVSLNDYKDHFDFNTPFIVYNGSAMKYLNKYDYIQRNDLEFEIAKKVVEKGVSLNTGVLIWADDELYLIGSEEKAINYTFNSGTNFIKIDNIEKLKYKGIHKVMFSDTKERIREIYNIFQKEEFKSSNYTISVPKILEFFNLKSSKGQTVLNYAKSLGIKQEEIICIGDGMNDISMIKMAGLGIAMDNACQELKEVADYITKSNEENGVAYAIEKFML